MALADRIAILNDGRIEQMGTPEEIYRTPRTRFVAEFIGESNILNGRKIGRRVRAAERGLMSRSRPRPLPTRTHSSSVRSPFASTPTDSSRRPSSRGVPRIVDPRHVRSTGGRGPAHRVPRRHRHRLLDARVARARQHHRDLVGRRRRALPDRLSRSIRPLTGPQCRGPPRPTHRIVKANTVPENRSSSDRRPSAAADPRRRTARQRRRTPPALGMHPHPGASAEPRQRERELAHLVGPLLERPTAKVAQSSRITGRPKLFSDNADAFLQLKQTGCAVRPGLGRRALGEEVRLPPA